MCKMLRCFMKGRKLRGSSFLPCIFFCYVTKWDICVCLYSDFLCVLKSHCTQWWKIGCLSKGMLRTALYSSWKEMLVKCIVQVGSG